MTCDHTGHDWADAGGGLLICLACEAEEWDGETDVACPAAGGVPCLDVDCERFGCQDQR
jgi:hypothetical protein